MSNILLSSDYRIKKYFKSNPGYFSTIFKKYVFNVHTRISTDTPFISVSLTQIYRSVIKYYIMLKLLMKSEYQFSTESHQDVFQTPF